MLSDEIGSRPDRRDGSHFQSGTNRSASPVIVTPSTAAMSAMMVLPTTAVIPAVVVSCVAAAPGLGVEVQFSRQEPRHRRVRLTGHAAV